MPLLLGSRFHQWGLVVLSSLTSRWLGRGLQGPGEGGHVRLGWIGSKGPQEHTTEGDVESLLRGQKVDPASLTPRSALLLFPCS